MAHSHVLNRLGISEPYEDGSGLRWSVDLENPTGDQKLTITQGDDEVSFVGQEAWDVAVAVWRVFRALGDEFPDDEDEE